MKWTAPAFVAVVLLGACFVAGAGVAVAESRWASLVLLAAGFLGPLTLATAIGYALDVRGVRVPAQPPPPQRFGPRAMQVFLVLVAAALAYAAVKGWS